MKNEILIERTCGTFPNQTNGVLKVVDKKATAVFVCITTELPNKGNQRNISCIPAGTYPAIKHRSPKFGEAVWIQEVPDRSEILIHPMNYVEQLRGCVGVGQFMKDVDGDGDADDMTSSRDTMKRILSMLPDAFTVTIKDAN